MKTKIFIVSSVIAIFILSVFASALAVPTDGKHGKNYITEKTDKKSLKEFMENGCSVSKKSGRIASLNCPDDTAAALKLTENIRVFAADTNANKQTGADAVWSMGYTGANSMVAVVDTGIDYNHQELKDSYAGGWNFVASNNNPYDDNGHGTHVSGIITANGIDPSAKGAAPDAKILALKVLGSDGSGTFEDVISAIYYAVDGPDGAYGTSDDPHTDAISMSLGTSSPYLYPTGNCDNVVPELTNAINYAFSKGVAVVAASGNFGTKGVSIPGCISGAISVGAVNSYDSRASWSGAGESLGIVAPGVNIYSSWPSGYLTASGTSMATPHISAVVALLKQANSALSVQQVKDALYKTAKDLGTAGKDKYYGWGRVDAAAAVNYVLPSVPVQPIHNVAVSSISAPASVIQGSVASIVVAVSNTGNQQETFTVTLSDVSGPAAIGSQAVTLSAGISQNLAFQYNTSASFIGNHVLKAEAATVAGENNTADNVKTAVIAVTEPPQPVHDVAISSIFAPAYTVKGSIVYVSVTAANPGNLTEAFAVMLHDETDSRLIGFRNMTLAAGAAQGIDFTYDTSSSSAGNHTLRAEAGTVYGESNTANNMKRTTMTVAEQVHDVAVSAISAPSSAVQGSAVSISAAVANLGNMPETFNVNAVDITSSSVIGSQQATLNPGTSQNLIFIWNTSASAAGNHIISVNAGAVAGENNTADNVKTAAVTITLPSVQPKMHVAGITMSTQNTGSFIRAVSTVNVVDASGSPVSGAKVTGLWSGLASNSVSGTTNSAGNVILYSSWKYKARGTFTITVNSIAKSGWAYDPSANALSSNSITV